MEFADAVVALEEVVLPFLQALKEEISQAFPKLNCRLYVGPGGDLTLLHSYSVLLACSLNAESSLLLITDVKQYKSESPIKLKASIYKEWRTQLETVFEIFANPVEVDETVFLKVLENLPHLKTEFMNLL